jgi:hypothetical protein
MGEGYNEFAERAEGDRYVGVSTGAGAEMHRALQQAARAAADDGQADVTFSVSIEIVVQEHNQWVKTYRVTITPTG